MADLSPMNQEQGEERLRVLYEINDRIQWFTEMRSREPSPTRHDVTPMEEAEDGPRLRIPRDARGLQSMYRDIHDVREARPMLRERRSIAADLSRVARRLNFDESDDVEE